MENKFPLWSISRLRMQTDGPGITTLVGAQGCPLNCKYCLNEPSKTFECTNWITPTELYEKVKVDNLYFLSTNGGITFGGGEPLLYPNFLEEFRTIVPKEWKLYAETSLFVPTKNIEIVAKIIDKFYVDIKDCNKEIYKAYTGESNHKTLTNLKKLIECVESEKIVVRVPLIPNYNTKKDQNVSKALLSSMGITNIDMFNYKIPKLAK